MSLTQEAIEQAYGAVSTRATTESAIKALRQLTAAGDLGPLISQSILSGTPLTPKDVDHLTDLTLAQLLQPTSFQTAQSRRLGSSYPAPGVQEYLNVFHELPPEITNGFKVVVIGGGPAGLKPARVLSDMGFEDVTIVTPDARLGGIWNGDNPVQEYNNPAAISLQREHLPFNLTDGSYMRAFLGGIVAGMSPMVIDGIATHTSKNGHPHVVYEKDGQQYQVAADMVIAATGNVPKPLTSSKMKTNAPDFEGKIERWQKLITPAAAAALDGKTVLCIGWGNSTRQQIANIEEANKRYGTNIRPVIITHFTEYGIRNPHLPCPRSDGSISPFARDPHAGEYTRFEADRPTSVDLLNRHLPHQTDTTGNYTTGGTITGVTSWQLHQKQDGTLDAFVPAITTDSSGNRAGDAIYQVPNIGAVYALLGYESDSTLLGDLGFNFTSEGVIETTSYDGQSLNDPWLFAMGVANVKPDNRSLRVLPGIIGQTQESVFTAAIQAATNALTR